MTTRGQAGSGSVFALGTIAALAVVAVAAIGTIHLLHLSTRVQRTADLAALAASDVSMGVVSGEPCPVAREVVERSGFYLRECVVDRGIAQVVVGDLESLIPIDRRARATPSPSPLWQE